MKSLSTLSNKEILHLVFQSKELTKRLDNYIYDSLFFWIEESLNCFSFSSVNYSIGIYNRNYFTLQDPELFLDDIAKYIKDFSGSEKLLKLYNQVEKLRYTNLFQFYAEKLCNLFYTENIAPEIEYIENLQFATYNKDTEDSELNDFIDNSDIQDLFNDVYINNSGKLVTVKEFN